MQLKIEERLNAFNDLGHELKNISSADFEVLSKKAERQNPWFTTDNIQLAFDGIIKMLDRNQLEQWVSPYDLNPTQSKSIGVALAGNIPLVGFHDYLSILISGHRAQLKLSSQDDVLLPYVHQRLTDINRSLGEKVNIVERLHAYDAAIATGSDNTGRYFSYYFKHVPHIIRKNRSSCAVLLGEEVDADFEELGKDIFTYFGLGCRNVSKLYIPEEFDLVQPLRVWEKFVDLTNHNKYANNYNYQRSINLVNLRHFYDNGAVLLIESESLVSPISVVYYERYTDQDDLKNRLGRNENKIQCMVSKKAWFNGSLDFGSAQIPDVHDYSDGVDTLAFLSKLN